MKFVITLIITLGAAVGFALIAMEDPGYVVLARAPYTIRLPLALFALAVFAAFVVVYLMFNAIAALLRAPRKFRAWRQRNNQLRAQLHTAHGYAKLIEGDWQHAEKKLLSHLPDNQSPLLNYLGAAFAAQQRGHLQRRDQYLADARAQYPKQRVAINLTAARLHYQAGEITESRDALEKIRRIAPKNIPTARLLADVYRELKDWHSLATLMPTLTRLKAFPEQELAMRERQAYQQYLSSPALLQGDGNRPTRAFKALPAAQQKSPAVVAGYVGQLVRAGENAQAEKMLRRALNRGWSDELAALYGTVETDFTGDQIKLARSWLKKYGEHHALTLALARLYRRNRQYDEAKDFFGRAVADGDDAAASSEFAAMLEECGERDAALRMYRHATAARLTVGDLPMTVTETELLTAHGDDEVMPVVK